VQTLAEVKKTLEKGLESSATDPKLRAQLLDAIDSAQEYGERLMKVAFECEMQMTSGNWNLGKIKHTAIGIRQ
jgi:hypothetical protein